MDACVPSALIAGSVVSPRKKEKQNAAREKNQAEWQHIQNLLDKIRGTGTGGISADDSDAIQKPGRARGSNTTAAAAQR